MAQNSATEEGEVFTSWKEIANFLGKGVRSVQRWERTLGLPVTRPDGDSAHTIVARRGDLEAWLAKSWSAAAIAPPPR